MKFYGHANMQQNQLQRAVMPLYTSFPSLPVIGELAFVNSILYICVSVTNSLPVWVPLTREITVYQYSQATASTSWAITHNLNTTSVNVQIYDSLSNVIIPDGIQVTGPNTVTVTFTGQTTGSAVIVTGHTDGNVKPTYAYTFFETIAATTWTINHNLGYNPIVRVFIGNQEVQPLTVSFPTTNQAVLTFTTAQVGVARLI